MGKPLNMLYSDIRPFGLRKSDKNMDMDRIGPHPWTVSTWTYHEIIIPYLAENFRKTPLIRI